ncbi:16S rRNA (uracil(1498)-N(3))-methyltransferase [Microbacterium sp. MMO-56]|uniref:16S rRNA (uracil(1498)-N(3))-methyltransferase n=1 Tax=unclassified Microbacterium TaxID=2609290 RepID=UPI003FA54529
MALHFLAEADASVSRPGDDRFTLAATLADARPGDTVTLRGAEAHHAVVVRRVRVGEAVTVGDGRGVWVTGTVSEPIAPKQLSVLIDGRSDVAPASPRLVLAQALAKGDRDELAVQAATELGADEIVPWQASRSVSRWDAAKAQKGVARWGAIVREAAKQAHRAWVPEVAEPATTAQLAARPNSRLLVLEPTAATALTTVDVDPDGADDLVLVVGPEGGISSDELDAFVAAGATPVRLGDTVLRTSTAGPAAIALLNARLARW